MRIEISAANHPCFNFVIHAENSNEAELIRQFCKYHYQHRLWLHSYGGNTYEGVESMCFGWREEKNFKPKGFWKKLKYLLS